MKTTTHLDQMSLFQIASGTDWSNRWTRRTFFVDAHRDSAAEKPERAVQRKAVVELITPAPLQCGRVFTHDTYTGVATAEEQERGRAGSTHPDPHRDPSPKGAQLSVPFWIGGDGCVYVWGGGFNPENKSAPPPFLLLLSGYTPPPPPHTVVHPCIDTNKAAVFPENKSEAERAALTHISPATRPPKVRNSWSHVGLGVLGVCGGGLGGLIPRTRAPHLPSRSCSRDNPPHPLPIRW